MFSYRSRQITHQLNVTIAAVTATVLVAGCGGGNASPTVASTPSTSSAASANTTSPSGDATLSSGLTGAETTWLAGVDALAKKMQNALGNNVAVTAKRLSEEAESIGGCGAELRRLRPPTDQFQSVFVLAEQGCAKYEEAGKCFAAAAKSGINDADKCLAPFNLGSALFSSVKVTADAIKDSVN